MRPSIAERLAAALLAGTFVLAGSADVYGLHHCPHHGHGPVPEAPSPAGPSQAEAGHERPDAGDASHRGHEEDGPCTCVGSCHASASAPLVPTGPGAEGEPVASAPGLAPEADDVLPAAPAPYLTPYPTGPPFRT